MDLTKYSNHQCVLPGKLKSNTEALRAPLIILSLLSAAHAAVNPLTKNHHQLGFPYWYKEGYCIFFEHQSDLLSVLYPSALAWNLQPTSVSSRADFNTPKAQLLNTFSSGMKLNFVLAVVALVPATFGRLWAGRNDHVAKLGGDENTPPKGKVEAVFYDGGYTISAASNIQLVKKSTISITDWVTVTRDPDSSETPSSSSTSTSPATGSLEGSPSSATAAESTSSLSSSEGPRPDNSTTSASLSPSSTSAVSGAPPITSSPSSSSEASTSTAIPSAETSAESSAESSHSSTLIAPPAPITSTAPAPSESLTEPASESSESSSSSSSSSTHWTPTTAPDRPPVTLTSLTSGFSAPISSTITFVRVYPGPPRAHPATPLLLMRAHIDPAITPWHARRVRGPGPEPRGAAPGVAGAHGLYPTRRQRQFLGLGHGAVHVDAHRPAGKFDQPRLRCHLVLRRRHLIVSGSPPSTAHVILSLSCSGAPGSVGSRY